jgi:hypothetical protein
MDKLYRDLTLTESKGAFEAAHEKRTKTPTAQRQALRSGSFV